MKTMEFGSLEPKWEFILYISILRNKVKDRKVKGIVYSYSALVAKSTSIWFMVSGQLKVLRNLSISEYEVFRKLK